MAHVILVSSLVPIELLGLGPYLGILDLGLGLGILNRGLIKHHENTKFSWLLINPLAEYLQQLYVDIQFYHFDENIS